MKKIILILAVAIMGLTSNVNAQKYGHFNKAELLTKVPGFATSEAYIIKYAKGKETAIKENEANLNRNIAKFQKEVETMTEIIKQREYKRIQDLQMSVEKFKQSSYEKVQEERKSLMEPLLAQLDAAIKNVGKANNFTYIFDTSSGVLAYFDGGTDISELVVAELKKNAAAATKASTPTKTK